METLVKILKKFSNHLPSEKAKAVQQVAIFGFADAKPEDEVYKDAFKVCKALGAKAGNGKVIGVTLYPKDAKHFEGRDIHNPIDLEIRTNTYVERTLTLMKEGQVYVVFNGASGTVSEFGMAWGLARIYFGHHKPLILYGKFWEHIMNSLNKNLLIRPEESKVYKIVHTPAGVLKAIRDFEEEIEEGRHKELKVSGEDGFAIP